jgi:DNA-binding MarR family transcriptional regulator
MTEVAGTASGALFRSFEPDAPFDTVSAPQAGADVIRLISEVDRLLRIVRDHFERAVLAEPDLHWSAFLTLYCLWMQGALETRRLAGKAGIAKSTLSGILNDLEKRGLLRRRTDADDCRLVLVNLTAPGRKLMRRLMEDFTAEEARMTSSLRSSRPAAMPAASSLALSALCDLALSQDRSDG